METKREILFAGISVKTNKFVYGFLNGKNNQLVAVNYRDSAIFIHPESLSAFTGLYDGTTWAELTPAEQSENEEASWKGKRIWENSVLRGFPGYHKQYGDGIVKIGEFVDSGYVEKVGRSNDEGDGYCGHLYREECPELESFCGYGVYMQLKNEAVSLNSKAAKNFKVIGFALDSGFLLKSTTEQLKSFNNDSKLICEHCKQIVTNIDCEDCSITSMRFSLSEKIKRIQIVETESSKFSSLY